MNKFFNNKKFLFWDFDGVIKESLEVKSLAFDELFTPFGKTVASKVVRHHQSNGGLSRYSKIPIYLNWANIECNEETKEHFCQAFSDKVKQAVIQSPWVPGVINTLNSNHKSKTSFLITATPQKEIEFILEKLDINYFFEKIVGSPTDKFTALKNIIKEFKVETSQAIFIGDSKTDYEAAKTFGIQFLLRKTSINKSLQKIYNGPQINNFLL